MIDAFKEAQIYLVALFMAAIAFFIIAVNQDMKRLDEYKKKCENVGGTLEREGQGHYICWSSDGRRIKIK